MFVQTEVLLGTGSSSVTLPCIGHQLCALWRLGLRGGTISRAKRGETYRGVRQQFVKLGPSRGDQVAVLSGVKAKEEVVTSGVFKLRNGAAVLVDNKVQPSNKPSPKPEDN
jgi:membrane fusion protein (multidrug efflux system)